MLMTCQCRLADCDKYATPVRGVDSGEAVHVSGQGVCENSIFSAQLCYEPKTVLKYKVFLKMRANSVLFMHPSASSKLLLIPFSVF